MSTYIRGSIREGAEKVNVFASVIEFSKQVDDDIRNHVFLPTRQQKVLALKERADLAIQDLDAIPDGKRQSKEDQAMYLYLRGKLLNVSPGYNQEAEQHLTNALKLKNDMVDAWICLGTCIWSRGDLDKAKSCYKFGLELDPNNKVLLCQLSMLERRLCLDETDIENAEKIIRESIKHAKDAIRQDIHDGLSWYFLGNAYLTIYFLTGTWDYKILSETYKAYKNAEKDEKMNCSVELCYNSSMTYKLQEDYLMALIGFESVRLVYPSLKSLEQILNLCAVLDDIDSLLKKMNNAKRISSPISPLPSIDSLASSLASVELDPSYERATVDRLTEGFNKGKAVTGKVLFSIENRSKRPVYYFLCDSDRNCFVITLYGVHNAAIKEEDQVTLLNPYYHFVDFEWKRKQYQFKSVRLNHLQQLRVNGAIVSPEHVIHQSMYAKFMEG